MCGIWFYLGIMPPTHPALTWVKTLFPRGPEDMRIEELSGNMTMGFTRLAINGLNNAGMQPFFKNKYESDELAWMCNGEIYNWRELCKTHLLDTRSGSDCEVLGELYEIYSATDDLTSFFRSLDGVFALVIVDQKRGRVVVGRDPYGIRPLFEAQRDDDMIFTSELKASAALCRTAKPFAPGTYQVWDIATKKNLLTQRYHDVPFLTNPMLTPKHPNGLDMACASLRFALEQAVEKRMMTERPVAALLSGGIDSSLIASLVQKNLRKRGFKTPLKTFSVGMKGSSDLKHAKMVADWIGSEHHEIVLTADDFFRVIPDVIRAIETFDTTTVRASVGNYLISLHTRCKSDCKVVFNGDGADEIFGSYLYFYNAPSERQYEEEVTRLLTDIHMYDVLRSDRTISVHGLEPRTPFLDKQFVAVARSIASEWRRPVKGKQVEKWILRRAFDDGVTLPHQVLWRRKEAFSDGVSSAEKSWYEEIQQRVKDKIPSDWKEQAEARFTHLTPKTEEQYYYRVLFEAEFATAPLPKCVPYFWMPRWSPGATDPSARTLEVYQST